MSYVLSNFQDFLHKSLKPKLNTNAIPSIFEIENSYKVPQSSAACCKKLDWSDEPFIIKPLPLSLDKSTIQNKSQEASLQVSIFYHTSYYF